MQTGSHRADRACWGRAQSASQDMRVRVPLTAAPCCSRDPAAVHRQQTVVLLQATARVADATAQSSVSASVRTTLSVSRSHEMHIARFEF